jgi:hypothetical protein
VGALAAPHPGRPPRWPTRASSPGGGGCDIPSTSPRATTRCPGGKHGKLARRGRGCCRGTAWSGCARPTGCHPIPACKIRDRCGEAGREATDPESDVWQPAGRRSESATEEPLIYISWYINGYGRPWTSLDVNPKMRHVHGHCAGSGGVLLATTDQMVSSHVPSADQYPRRGDGRKGACRRRTRWRQRHPCPRHHDEHSGQDKGTGQE